MEARHSVKFIRNTAAGYDIFMDEAHDARSIMKFTERDASTVSRSYIVIIKNQPTMCIDTIFFEVPCMTMLRDI